jgi:hypothetical protein
MRVSACEDSIQHGLTVEIVLANVFPVTMHDGHTFTISLEPIRIFIDIAHG